MGSVLAKPLAEISKEEIENHVIALGPEFAAYASLVDDNGIDGDLLSEMNEKMFLETLDDVAISNPSHRTTLLQEFRIYCNVNHAPPPNRARHQGPVREVVLSGSARSVQSSHDLHSSNRSSNTSERTDNNDHSHLAPDFYKAVDSHYPQASRPPIARDDMDRVAHLESYKLDEIEPDSEIAQKLSGLVQMAMNLFDIDMGDITFLNNQYQFSIARVGLTQPMEDAIIGKIYEALNFTSNGKAFLCRTDRSVGICNYPHYSKRTFVVQDIEQDEAFRWLASEWPFRCYVGAPLLSASGFVIGTLCMHNLDPRPDFDRDCEMQLEQVAAMVVQSIENWRLRRNITTLESTRKALQCTKNKSEPPVDTAVVVFTGIEDYDALIDADPEPMEAALILYTGLLEKLRDQYFGYQVATMGDDGHFLVFHDAVDAFGFALELQQQLYEVDWPDDLLCLPRASDNGSGFRGLRVKVGVHMGAVTAIKVAPTGRTQYKSPNSCTIGIAKNLYTMAYGGQILTTFDTWNIASFMAETKLESPQVVDLGTHVVRKGRNTNEGVVSKRIVQLVPEPLAVNYSELGKPGDGGDDLDSSLNENNASGIWGRHFPDIKSLNKLSPSFFDAPGFKDSGLTKVTIAFIGTSEIEKRYEEAASIVAQIIGLASSALNGTPGYQCQNNMLAFPNISAAVEFGLHFSELLGKQEPLAGNVSLASLITYGCVYDTFITLEPHKTTGRADYFGKVVNRAARVAYTSELGSVSAGVTVTPGFKEEDFGLEDPSISVQYKGLRKLKGVDGEMAIFECKRKHSLLQQ